MKPVIDILEDRTVTGRSAKSDVYTDSTAANQGAKCKTR